MKIKHIIITSIILCAFASCRDYVEVDSYSERTLKYTTDFEYVMNNRYNFETSVILPLITGDDTSPQAGDIPNIWYPSYFYNAFIWGERFYETNQQDGNWANPYKHIYVSNEVLDGVMGSLNGTQELKNKLAGEAKVHRAFAYMTLINLYAPVYNPATADKDPGVPILLTVDLSKDLSRSTVQQVYDQILDDLLTSIDHLPNYPTYNHHPSKLAAYALLSRVYLTMRNFPESAKYADLALAISSDLLDLKEYKDNTSTFPKKLKDPEIILSKVVAGTYNIPLNPELIALYHADDLRFQLFFENNSGWNAYKYRRPSYTSEGTYIGLKIPELILNRAEVYAREGNADKTVEMLNMLRVKRFETDKYVPLKKEDISADLLQAVIDERRREFVSTDIRWFDMRRLTLDPSYAKTVTRQYKEKTYTLEPGSPRYVYPIDETVLKFNPEIGQNPR